ncbi:hypothetical protein ETB97_005003 [Aspergillus alliaceus]|uniref:Uncharacterized protein n=1 Tax=Petromyces alliaceus TaxID=209559 RepID=A0A8H6E3F0_PETAA|nr:hypothetical protein ETB97_005003 [Aspergillus burnettii]
MRVHTVESKSLGAKEGHHAAIACAAEFNVLGANRLKLVASCKKLGMLYYPNMLSRYGQDDLAAYVWVSIEEVKRFNLALYKVCRAFSKQENSVDNLDIAGAGSRGLRARDLRFPLPRNTPLWNAVSKAEWVSAATEDVYRHSLHDTLEAEWISKSAKVLELIET